MKILHVAETAKGGVGTYLDELIVMQQAMLPPGSVCAIVPAQHRPQLASIDDSHVVTFDRPGRSISSLWRLRRQILAQIDRFQPDVLHLHSSFPGMIGRTLWRTRGCRAVVYQPHGWAFEMWTHGFRRRIFGLIERLLAPLCSRIIVVSEAERKQALAIGIDPERLVVVLNGIASAKPEATARAWGDDRRRVLFIGRLDRQKGVDTLLRIAARNKEAMSVRIVGEGVTGDQSGLAIPPNVECLGWLSRSALTGHLDACDLLAMPSRWEAFGLTAVEAMRSAKPVIAFGVGGLGEVVADGETGILVKPEDEEAFEAALLQPSPETLRRMGEAGRARFETLFTSRRMAEDILALYRAIVRPGF